MTGENQMYMPVAPAYGMGGDMFGYPEDRRW